MEAHIGISAGNRKKVAEILNALLADEFLLYVKMLNYHWNVKSNHFRDMHKLFLDLYEDQLQICDDVAERIRSIDEDSFGTMQEYTKHTQLKEQPGKKFTDQEMVKNLVVDHETIIRTIRKIAPECLDKYEDLGTNNFLLNLLEVQEKTAWMLRASLVK